MPTGGGVIEAKTTWSGRTNRSSGRQHRPRVGDLPQDIEGTPFETADGAPNARRQWRRAAFRLAGCQRWLGRSLPNCPPGRCARQPGRPVTFAADGLEVEVAGRPLRAAQGILAVPPALAVEQLSFRPDLPASMRESARRVPVWMAGMIKAIAVYDADFWHPLGLAGAAISYAGPFREFHDHSGPEGSPAAIFGFAPAENFAHADSRRSRRRSRPAVRPFGDEAARPRELRAD